MLLTDQQTENQKPNTGDYIAFPLAGVNLMIDNNDNNDDNGNNNNDNGNNNHNHNNNSNINNRY